MVASWITWDGAAFWMLGLVVGSLVVLWNKRRYDRRVRLHDERIDRQLAARQAELDRWARATSTVFDQEKT